MSHQKDLLIMLLLTMQNALFPVRYVKDFFSLLILKLHSLQNDITSLKIKARILSSIGPPHHVLEQQCACCYAKKTKNKRVWVALVLNTFQEQY